MSTVDFRPDASAAEPATRSYADAGVSFLRSAIRSLAAQAAEPRALVALEFARRTIDGLDQDALRDVALSPTYRFWQTSLGAAVRSGARQPVEELAAALPQLLVAAALRAGGDFTVDLTADDGQLRLPGLPRHLRLSQGTADGPVSLSRTGDSLLIRHGDFQRELAVDELLRGSPGLVEHARLPHSDVELDASGVVVRGWLAAHNAVVSSPLHPRRDVVPSLRAAGEYHHFDAAAELIRAAWPECFIELRRQVRLVIPFTSRLMAGWTSQDKLGSLFIRDVGPADPSEAGDEFAEQVAYTADRLVHESAHTRLYHLMFTHRLFTDDDAARCLLDSPLRKDARPAVGVMHAVFVLGRVSVFMQRASELTGQERFRDRAEQAAAAFVAGRDVLAAAGVLNADGLQLLQHITSELPDVRTLRVTESSR